MYMNVCHVSNQLIKLKIFLIVHYMQLLLYFHINKTFLADSKVSQLVGTRRFYNFGNDMIR